MKFICYLTLVLPALLARGYVGSHGIDGHKGMDKTRNVRQSELNPLEEMFSKKDVDKNIGSKIRETRAVDFSVSVDLDVKKEKTGSKLKKNRFKMKKMLRKQRIKKEKERLKRRKMAKAALKLGVAMYKDVMPVVGALAISSGEMMREKVIPAMKQFGEETSVRAGRVASETMKSLREYAPLVRDTLKSSMNNMMVGMRKAGAEVSAAAKEFQSRYSSALAKIRAREGEEKLKDFHRTPDYEFGSEVAVKITPR